MAESTDMAASHRDVLATIGRLHDETPPKGNEIAANCAVGDAHIYHILGVLADNGFIERQSDPVDERVTRNALTKKGYETLEALKAQYTAVNQPATLPADSAQETEDDARQNLRTDGGLQSTGSSPTDTEPTISILIDDDTVEINTNGTATLQVRPNHERVAIEAAEAGDRTAETVIEGSPESMTAVADQIYAAAAKAGHDADDPEDGDADG